MFANTAEKHLQCRRVLVILYVHFTQQIEAAFVTETFVSLWEHTFQRQISFFCTNMSDAEYNLTHV